MKVREAMQSIEGVAPTARRTATEVTQATAMRGTRALGGEKGVNGQTETGKTPLQVLLEALSEQRNLIGELCNVVSGQQSIVEELHRQSQEHQRQT
jgi:hypothetical protein